MILVINEWIFHDLLSENGADKFRETAEFVVNLVGTNDRLVIPNEERWKRKAYQLMTDTNPRQREVSKLFHRLVRDSSRSIYLLSDDTSSPPHIPYDWVPSKDIYLIEACDATNADLLVTTDQTLFDRVTERRVVACQMRDDFLATYETAR